MKRWMIFLLVVLFGLVGGCTTNRNILSKDDEAFKQRIAEIDRSTNEIRRRTEQLNAQNKEKMRQEWGTDDPVKVLYLREEKKQDGLSRIKIGMKDETVRALCGAPYKINQTITSSYVHEQWIYITYPRFIIERREFKYSDDLVFFNKLFSANIYLYFESGVLTGIQKEK